MISGAAIIKWKNNVAQSLAQRFSFNLSREVGRRLAVSFTSGHFLDNEEVFQWKIQ